MRRRAAAAAIMLALSACQVQNAPTGVAKSARPSTGPGTASATPSAAPTMGASAAPRATASPAGPAASPSPAALERLVAPSGATSKLTGTIKVDATYMVASGAGQILSHNGAQVVAPKGTNLVAAGAGNLVAAGAGNLVAAGGLNLVAAGGLNLVAAGAGNLVAAGGLNYALAQSSAAPAAPAAGQQLPAAGMLISVASLTTRKYLPLGQDGAGQPVYVVLSDATGGYELFVPEGEDENLLVIVQPPGQPDPRLVLNTFTPRAEVARRLVDEDSAIAARYLRTCMIARLDRTLVTDDPRAMTSMFIGDGAAISGIEQILDRFVAFYRGIAKAKGIEPGTTDAKVVTAMSQAIADAALAMLDLEAIEMDPAVTPGWAGDPKAKATVELGAALRELRERGARYLADPADPTRYRERIDAAFLARVNELDREGNPWNEPVPALIQPNRRFLAPADFPAFVVEEYMAPHRDTVWSPLSNLYTYLESDPTVGPSTARAMGDRFSDRVRHSAAAIATTLAVNLTPLADGAEPSTPAGLAAAAAARAFDPASVKPE